MRRFALVCLLATASLCVADLDGHAVAVSQGALRTLQKIRGGTPQFYSKLFTSLQIYLCDQLNHRLQPGFADAKNAVWDSQDATVPPYIRFVRRDHPNALKDGNGTCIQAPHAAQDVLDKYAAGYCEVQPNCYWTDPRNVTAADADRTPFYSKEQATPPTSSLTVSAATSELYDWARAIALCIAPAIALAVVSLLSILIYLSCRYCCNRCGGRHPSPRVYSFRQKSIPIGLFVLFGIAIAALSIVALVYNKVIVSSVDGTFDDVLNLVNGTKSWLQAAEEPLVHVRDTVDGSVDLIAADLANSTFVEEGLNGFVTRLDAFAAKSANVVLPTGCDGSKDVICIACDVCTTINSQTTAAKDQMQSIAAQGIDQLATARQIVLSTLVDANATIQSSVNDGVNMLDAFGSPIASVEESITDVQTTWKEQTLVRRAAIVALFALALVIVVLGLVGIFFGLTIRCRPLVFILHFAYAFGILAIVLLFIVSAVFLALSVLMTDVCHLSDYVAADWTPLLGGIGGAAINACFRNDSLVHALQLDDAFAFAHEISIPHSTNLLSMLDFSALDIFAAQILAANETTFPELSSLTNSSLGALNVYTSAEALSRTFPPDQVAQCAIHDGQYELSSIKTPWMANHDAAPDSSTSPSSYMASRYKPYRSGCSSVPISTCARRVACPYDLFVTELYSNTSTLVDVSKDAAAFVSTMHSNMKELQMYASTFKTNVTALVAALDDVGDTLASSLLKDVDAFQAHMTCTFVATDFHALQASVCDNLTPAILMVAICLFFGGICMLLVVVALLLLVQRLSSPPPPSLSILKQL
ncbi:unnamed protein product [Aphanomyces euteiches]